IQLARLAQQIDRPPLDATLTVGADASVVLAPSQIGRRLDTAASAARVSTALADADAASVELVVVETPPRVNEAQLQPARESAERILAAPFVLRGRDGATWRLTREQLVPMLRVDQPDGQPARVLVDESELRTLVREAADAVNQDVRDARLDVNPDGTLEYTNARLGHEVDV